jgi:hypothetical protein
MSKLLPSTVPLQSANSSAIKSAFAIIEIWNQAIAFFGGLSVDDPTEVTTGSYPVMELSLDQNGDAAPAPAENRITMYAIGIDKTYDAGDLEDSCDAFIARYAGLAKKSFTYDAVSDPPTLELVMTMDLSAITGIPIPNTPSI